METDERRFLLDQFLLIERCTRGLKPATRNEEPDEQIGQFRSL